MTTNDHDFPPADDGDYAANPKKSQAVAAAKRARRALGPAPDAPAVVRQPPLMAYGAGVVIALLIGMMSYQLGTSARPLQLPAPTSAPTAEVQRAREATFPAISAPPTQKAVDSVPSPVPPPVELPVSAPIRHDAPAVQQADWTPPEPTADFYTTPPQVDPAFQQSLIGSDPNALACNGSVWCGGLTNAEAQAALDAQRATAAAR